MPNINGSISGSAELTGALTKNATVGGEAVVGASVGGTTARNTTVKAIVQAATTSLAGRVQLTPGNTGTGGTTDHSKLTNRNLPDQHSMSAITGLSPELEKLNQQDVTLGQNISELNEKQVLFSTTLAKKADGMELDEAGRVYLTSGGTRIAGPFGPFGSITSTNLKVTNTTGWLYGSVGEGRPCVLSFNWSSVEDGLATGKGTLQVYVGNAVKTTVSIEQGDVEIDVAEWLNSGSNTIKLVIADAYGSTKNLNFTVEVVSLSIKSTFDGNVAYSGAISYYYTPVGAVEKTVHFILDGEEIDTAVVMLSNQQQDFVIPAQEHGSHTFEVYFTAKIGESDVESNHLYYDLICTEEGRTETIIASTFRGEAVEQYDTFTVPYRVYDPASLTAAIVLAEDGNTVQELTVDRTEHKWSHRLDTVGTSELTITCGDTVKRFQVPVTKSTVTVTAVTNNLILDLSSHGRSNLEADPLVWESNGVSCVFTGFNTASDGWQLDEEGVTVLRVGGDARLTIPLKLFEQDIRTTGKTIEIEFATRAVLNYGATIVSCMDGGRGLEITSQQALAASAQSSIGTQYKEEEHIRLSFIVEKRTGSKMMLCYLNGICSGSVAYPDEDDFMQNNAVEISIGSSECTIDLYHVRVYDNDLTRYQVLNNWIADTQTGALKKARWERNDVYDAYGNIVIDKLPKDLPYLVLEASVLPQFKGDKKTCAGYYVDPVNPERSFRFEGTQIDVQGTSSQYYKVKNYKLKYKTGFTANDGTSSAKYALNGDAVPVDTFTFKADVASSEGANNVVLAQIFDDLCPVKTPAMVADPRVRYTIDGHPIVVFWDNGTGPKFVGKYNFNNDKGTPEVFGFKQGDESWEILQNGTDRVGFKNADFAGDDWKNDFEARYPEDNTDTTRLAAFISWVASLDPDKATGGSDTRESRIARFVEELPDWANVEQCIFYYLFTLVFLCIDQREKNAFPTFIKDMNRWVWLFYDADSSLGINNKGALAFDPFLEDIDYTEAGDPVFNGQANVFWNLLRVGFADQIEAMYQSWRVNGVLSYEIVKNRFDTHQGKWPEAIFNEDGYKKCLAPWIDEGDATYLPMNLGKKELQRAWWLFNRFRYLDSKYVTGTSMENRILIRAHSLAPITLMAYVKMYGNVFFNALRVSKRMEAWTEYSFEWTASGAEDAVIGINDADMITSLGDLSPLMIETIDLSGATHLTYLKLGDGSEGYQNRNLLSLTLGNNTLLKTVDVRNCPNLTQNVGMSGCTNVEEVYFDGTAITGLSLPNGGNLKVLHLPETMVNLTLRNQTALTEFEIPSYENISTLWLENVSSIIDPIEILGQIPANSRVRLIGVHMAVDSYQEIVDFIARLDVMRGIDENNLNVATAQVSGTIYLEEVTQPQLNEIAQWQSRYPSLAVLYSRIETYTVRFWVDGVLEATVPNVAWGADVQYPNETPSRPETTGAVWEFVEWLPAPENVIADMDCYAQFRNTIPTIRLLVEGTLTGDYYNDRVTQVGVRALSYLNLGEVVLPNTTTIHEVFPDSTVKRLVIPSVTGWGHSPFMWANIDKIELRDITSLNWNTFNAANIRAMIIRSRTIPSLNCNVPSITYFYVYSDMIDSYKAATNWSNYADQIRAIEDYPEITGGL